MRSIVAVFVGGFVGTVLRFLCTLSTPASSLFSPWIINVAGAFVLGLLVSWLWVKPNTPEWIKAGLGTGVLGGFTTFSAIALAMGSAFLPFQATTTPATVTSVAVLFVVELLLGFLAAWLGLVLGTAITKRVAPVDVDAISDEGVDL